jgi:hypothetical protein
MIGEEVSLGRFASNGCDSAAGSGHWMSGRWVRGRGGVTGLPRGLGTSAFQAACEPPANLPICQSGRVAVLRILRVLRSTVWLALRIIGLPLNPPSNHSTTQPLNHSTTQPSTTQPSRETPTRKPKNGEISAANQIRSALLGHRDDAFCSTLGHPSDSPDSSVHQLIKTCRLRVAPCHMPHATYNRNRNTYRNTYTSSLHCQQLSPPAHHLPSLLPPFQIRLAYRRDLPQPIYDLLYLFYLHIQKHDADADALSCWALPSRPADLVLE